MANRPKRITRSSSSNPIIRACARAAMVAPRASSRSFIAVIDPSSTDPAVVFPGASQKLLISGPE